MNNLKKSEIMNKFHIGVYLYLTFGWMISDLSCKFLLFLTPTVITQWGINNNKCILTKIEHILIQREKEEEIILLKKDDTILDKKDEMEKKDNDEVEKKDKDESFLRGLCNQYGIEISNRGLNILSYLTIYHSFLQSYWRVVF